MKTLKFLALLGAMLSPTAFVSATAHAKPAKSSAIKVNWQPSYFAALKAAKRSGKPLFIDFYTDWCGPCKYLDQTTYRNAHFVAYSRGWIMVKVNPEKSALGRQLFSKYSLSGFPSMVFTNASGRKYGQAVGTYPAYMLIPEMKKAAKKASGTRV